MRAERWQGLYSVRVIPIFLLTSCMRSIIILDSVFAKKKCRKRGEGKGNGNSCRSLESALKRFKRKCARSGVLAEVRRREHYEKPSVKRKKKAEAARKRKY